MKNRSSSILAALLSLLPALPSEVMAQSSDGTDAFHETTAEHDARMAWWRDARFGMFVHWGLYSGLAGNWDGKQLKKGGGMEWIQQYVKADTDAYAAQALPLFQPKPGFAREWMKLAKQAGCRYVVFTTKHHEGFSLHDSKTGDFNAGAKLKRDLVKEIVEAARAEGLKIGFYHSLIDWHHDQYEYAKAKGLPHPLAGKAYPNGKRDHELYKAHLHSQVKELLAGYGKVDILWWDFSSQAFQGDPAWGATDLVNMVRTLQPQVIMNNRLYSGATTQAAADESKLFNTRKGDFTTPEQRIPATGMPGVDWETCMTLNGTWGYSEYDKGWKSDKALIRNLVEIASKGGNYLLNIGPKGDGSLCPETIKAFTAIGRWMKVNAESIHGTTASPFEAPDWGRATRKGGVIYLHVQEWPKDGVLTVPMRNHAVEALLLAEPATKIPSSSTPEGLKLKLPKQAPDPHVSVVKLVVKGEPDVLPVENAASAKAP
jgi:alpha-L-fucosidase